MNYVCFVVCFVHLFSLYFLIFPSITFGIVLFYILLTNEVFRAQIEKGEKPYKEAKGIMKI